MSGEQDRLLKLSDAAKLNGIPVRRLRQLRAEGLPFYRLSVRGPFYVIQRELLDFVRQRFQRVVVAGRTVSPAVLADFNELLNGSRKGASR